MPKEIVVVEITDPQKKMGCAKGVVGTIDLPGDIATVWGQLKTTQFMQRAYRAIGLLFPDNVKVITKGTTGTAKAAGEKQAAEYIVTCSDDDKKIMQVSLAGNQQNLKNFLGNMEALFELTEIDKNTTQLKISTCFTEKAAYGMQLFVRSMVVDLVSLVKNAVKQALARSLHERLFFDKPWILEEEQKIEAAVAKITQMQLPEGYQYGFQVTWPITAKPTEISAMLTNFTQYSAINSRISPPPEDEKTDKNVLRYKLLANDYVDLNFSREIEKDEKEQIINGKIVLVSDSSIKMIKQIMLTFTFIGKGTESLVTVQECYAYHPGAETGSNIFGKLAALGDINETIGPLVKAEVGDMMRHLNLKFKLENSNNNIVNIDVQEPINGKSEFESTDIPLAQFDKLTMS